MSSFFRPGPGAEGHVPRGTAARARAWGRRFGADLSRELQAALWSAGFDHRHETGRTVSAERRAGLRRADGAPLDIDTVARQVVVFLALSVGIGAGVGLALGEGVARGVTTLLEHVIPVLDRSG